MIRVRVGIHIQLVQLYRYTLYLYCVCFVDFLKTFKNSVGYVSKQSLYLAWEIGNPYDIMLAPQPVGHKCFKLPQHIMCNYDIPTIT